MFRGKMRFKCDTIRQRTAYAQKLIDINKQMLKGILNNTIPIKVNEEPGNLNYKDQKNYFIKTLAI